MDWDALVLASDPERTIALARAIGALVNGEVTYLDGSWLTKRGDPSKNWIARPGGESPYGLIIVERSAVEEMGLMGLDDECARLVIPILVITETQEPPFVVFGPGGPYRDSNPTNPPWRYVCREAGLNQAIESFNAWL